MKMNLTTFKYKNGFDLELKQQMKKLDLVLISFLKLLEKLFCNFVLMYYNNYSQTVTQTPINHSMF